MSYTTDLSGYTIIDDDNAHLYVNQVLDPDYPFSGGYIADESAKDPFQAALYTGPIYSDSDLEDMIREADERQVTLDHLHIAADLPILDQNGLPYCHPPETLIRMADGSEKMIADIKVGDLILTAEGNTQLVQRIHIRQYRGTMITVKSWGHSHLRATPNHRILTKRGYVRVDKLTNKDWVALPRYAPASVKVVQVAEHVRVGSRQLANAGVPTSYYNQYGDKVGDYNAVPDFIELNERTGRIFGLFLAEGHLHRAEVAWSFNLAEEKHTLGAELVRLLESEWGCEVITEDKVEGNVFQVRIVGTLWVRLFKSLCGKLAHGKYVHGDLASGPEEFRKAMLFAWIDGDGSEVRDRQKGATVSKSLAHSMFDIAQSLGLRPAIRKEAPQVNSAAASRLPCWKVLLSSQSDNWRVQQTETHVWRKVREIGREQYTGAVHTLGVPGDHSFVADGIGSHNCWCYGFTGAIMARYAYQGLTVPHLSATSLAARIKNYAKEGGWAKEALQGCERFGGIATIEHWGEHELDPRLDTAEMRANAALHRPEPRIGAEELPAGDFNALVSALLNGWPTTMGLGWWGHLVYGLKPVVIERGSLGVLIANSWKKSWEQNGKAVLRKERCIADEMLAIKAVKHVA